MPTPPVPANENVRLKALAEYKVLDTLPEPELDAITKLASHICQTPIALISLIDGERQWFKSRVGLDVQETQRDISFCQYAIMGNGIFEVPNALEDKRFHDNPLVVGGPSIRFYAGIPLENPEGLKMGTLCVIDSVPRTLTSSQKEALKVLSRQVMLQFELRHKNAQLLQEHEELHRNRKMLKAIASATDELISTTDYIEAITRCLPLLGEAVAADLNFLFKNSINGDNGTITSQLLRWDKAVGATQEGKKELQKLPLSIFGQSMEQLQRNEVYEVVLSDLNKSAELKQLMLAHHIYSLLFIPIFLKNEFWGFVGYGCKKYERKWGENEKSLLKSFANSIANAIERAESAREMYNMALFPLENPEPMFRINLDGELILKNKAAGEMTDFGFDGKIYSDHDFFLFIAEQLSEKNQMLSMEVTHKEKFYSVIARLLENSPHINIYTSDITRQKRTEKELERLSMVAKANTKGIFFISLEGKVTWCNNGFTELTQYSRQEIFTTPLVDNFIGPLTQLDVIEMMSEAFLKGEVVEYEIIIYRKDRSWFWANVKIQPLKDDNGQLTEYYTLVEDIDEKKKAEELLKESESRMSVIIQNLHSGIMLKDENRRVVLVNKRFNELFNLSQSAVKKEDNFVDLNNKLKAYFKDSDAFEERIDQILEKGEKVLGEELELADGRCFERDYIPVFTDNKYKGHLWKYVDITSRKNYESNLKSQEEKYRSIITNMNLGLIEVDMQGIIQNVNQTFCKDLGYSVEELMGRRAMRVLGFESNREDKIPPHVLLDVYRIPVQNKRGTLRWWLLSGAPNYNDQGMQTGFVIINLDITEHKRLEEELLQAKQQAEESGRAKESFFANMSHEIRTPLNAIIGMVKELSLEQLTNKQRLYVHHATSASQHLLSLVNNILDISKIGAGELHLENRAFSLREALYDTVTIMKPAAKEKVLSCEVTISDDIAPAFLGDPNRIRQILINLISNSIKFTERGGVTISCTLEEKRKSTQQVRIVIADTGIGIDATYLKAIFKKFTQADASTARKYGGTGLGMSITYELVQLMRGSIEVFSNKGKGTRVELLLPFDIADKKEIANAFVASSVSNLKNKKLLLVEDNELNRMVATNALNRYDVVITEATNGLEAVELLKRETFDLVLMDLQMPVMDGVEATKIIRNELKLSTPIIAFTANAFKNVMEQRLASGMDAYVIKPFEEKVLIETIQQVLAKAQPEDQQTLIPPSTKLYRLDNLIELCQGNTIFIKKMLSVFENNTTAAVQEMKKAYQVHDYDTIRRAAHRIKPSIEKLGIVVLQQDILQLEKFNTATIPLAELHAALERVESVINNVVAGLAKEEI